MRRIAVVGGGVTGCSVAWHLKSRGLGEVCLFERDALGSGTTWHSAGLVSWGPQGDYNEPVLYLRDLIPRLEAQTGLSTGWRNTGRLYLARDAAGLERYAAFHDKARACGVDVRFLSPAEAAAFNPYLTGPALFGACYNPMSGRLNPADLVQVFARAARNLGANLFERTGVSRLQIRSGRVTGIVTSDGERHDFDDVVICAGIWSPDLLAPADILLAHGACEHMYVILATPQRLPPDTPAFLSSPDLIYGREEVGGMLLGCFDRDASVVDVASLPDPFSFTLFNENWDQFAPYLEAAADFFPVLHDAPVTSFVNGPEAFTPDGNPFIGPAPGVNGLWMCTGMNSHGVTISAATGHVVADMLADRAPRFATGHYAPQRFAEQPLDADWVRREISQSPSANF